MHTKSPDASFIPVNIQIPPAKVQPGTAKPGFIGAAFPTVILEMAHHHKPWHVLLRDTREKAFSARTSIQVVVGIKFFASDFKVFWAKRHRQGGMKVMRTTEKLHLDRTTLKFLLLPSNLIYWRYPHPPAPITTHFRFDLEGYRKWITTRYGL